MNFTSGSSIKTPDLVHPQKVFKTQTSFSAGLYIQYICDDFGISLK